ncbi:MAG: hypothetical protein KDE45_01425 [Caldilineaceae bacterium]|nr:hypothetical protein [Caldilineaceae bacterium]
MDLDIPHLLTDLAARRPVFHSEADFQHELALHIRDVHPNLQVRLEYPLARPGNAAIDILIRNDREEMALELKYLCQRIDSEINGELFALKPQGAQDVRRYDVLKDITRMEQFLASRPKASAAVLVLSNDPHYWQGHRNSGTIDAAFDLREGRTTSGKMGWAEHAGTGSIKGRETPLQLRGTYTLYWHDYSRIDNEKYGVFRFLYIPVLADQTHPK